MPAPPLKGGTVRNWNTVSACHILRRIEYFLALARLSVEALGIPVFHLFVLPADHVSLD